jgi:hypothetical protein
MLPFDQHLTEPLAQPGRTANSFPKFFPEEEKLFSFPPAIRPAYLPSLG